MALDWCLFAWCEHLSDNDIGIEWPDSGLAECSLDELGGVSGYVGLRNDLEEIAFVDCLSSRMKQCIPLHTKIVFQHGKHHNIKTLIDVCPMCSVADHNDHVEASKKKEGDSVVWVVSVHNQ